MALIEDQERGASNVNLMLDNQQRSRSVRSLSDVTYAKQVVLRYTTLTPIVVPCAVRSLP